MRKHAYCFVIFSGILFFGSHTFAALAAKNTGKAVTSANLSTNPTIRKQQLLVDPASPEPLMLTYARLDLLIHLDTPIGYSAQDVVQSIVVSPLAPHFLSAAQQPFYYAGESSYNVTFNGLDILVSGFAEQWDVNNPPPVGEVDHAVVDIQYNTLLPTSVYNNVLATFTVQSNMVDSEIRGMDANGATTTFDALHIESATDSGRLGVPEPAMLGSIAGLGAILLGRLRRRVG